MKNLNSLAYPPDYFRVMERRIKYYEDKYDPHTIIVDRPEDITRKHTGDKRKRGMRIARVCVNFFSFF